MSRSGALYCLASAAGFGAMGVFGKLAYDEGVTVGTLLSTRFVLAAVVFWLILVCARGGIRELRSLTRRDLLIAVPLGAGGYGAQAGAFFAALDRLDASLLALLVYTYPVLVAVASIAIGREPARRSTAVSLALASTGLVLVLAGPPGGGRGAPRAGPAGTAAAGHTRRPGRRRPRPRCGDRRGLRLAGRARGGLHGRSGRPVLRRTAARGPHGRVDPVDPRAGGHRRAGIRRVRRVARSRAAHRRCARPCGRTHRPGAAQTRTGSGQPLTKGEPHERGPTRKGRAGGGRHARRRARHGRG